MYTVYILRSKTTGKRYIGYTSDFEDRLVRHNTGKTQTTRNQGKDWKLIYSENYASKVQAIRREKELKKMKGGVILQRILEEYNAGIV